MSQDGLLLSSQCERQPSHLEVTEWDLYQPALDILAVVFYTFTRRRGRWRGGVQRGEGDSKIQKGILVFAFCVLWELGANVIGQPTRRSGPTAIGYLWFPSRGKTCV